MVIYGWLALRWAIEQFQREEVLFREAERLDFRLWLRRLLREKDAVPSTGQALFCFALVLGLHRLTLSVGSRFVLPGQVAIGYLAFVAAPPLFMALLLTTRPRIGLSLRLPPWWAWPVAIALAAFLFIPGVELSYLTVQALGIADSLREYERSIAGDFPGRGPLAELVWLVGALSLLQAVSEELVFRGFILSGLQRRFRPRTAVLLCAFLFALFHMNVFQFVPHFTLGVVLGALATRTGSVFPAMVFHFAYNSLVYGCLAVGPTAFPKLFGTLAYEDMSRVPYVEPRLALSLTCLATAGVTLWRLVRRPAEARQSASRSSYRGPLEFALPEAK
jgi:sodium transport system permease protein